MSAAGRQSHAQPGDDGQEEVVEALVEGHLAGGQRLLLAHAEGGTGAPARPRQRLHREDDDVQQHRENRTETSMSFLSDGTAARPRPPGYNAAGPPLIPGRPGPGRSDRPRSPAWSAARRRAPVSGAVDGGVAPPALLHRHAPAPRDDVDDQADHREDGGRQDPPGLVVPEAGAGEQPARRGPAEVGQG